MHGWCDAVVCILASFVLCALLSLPPLVIPLGLFDVILLLLRITLALVLFKDLNYA
jgi:hypothetical protein